MPRATVLVVIHSDDDWRLADERPDRWHDRVAVCSDEPDGCICSIAFWDVDVPRAAMDELPPRLLVAGESSPGSPPVA